MSSGGGFFGFFNYSKPGPGVRKDEQKRSRFAHFFVLVKRKFWKLIQLNLLYLLFCVPIVTIGPATAAMSYVLRLYTNEQPVFLLSDFWDAFKSNWKQAFVHSVIIAGLTFVVGTAINFYRLNAAENSWMYLLLGLSLMIALLGILANLYMSLMIVTLDLKLWHIIKNSVFLAILCLKTNLLTLLFGGLFLLVMFLFFPFTIFVMLFIGFAFLNFIIVYNGFPGIDKYAIQPFIKQQEEELEEDFPLLEEESKEETVFVDEYLTASDDDKLEKFQLEKDKKANAAADDFLSGK